MNAFKTLYSPWFLRLWALTAVLLLTSCIPSGDKEEHKDKSGHNECKDDEDDVRLEAEAKWHCTNEIGQTFYSKSPKYCADYYKRCMSAGDLPIACIDPQLKQKEHHSCTVTATSTGTSTSTATYTFPNAGNKTCTVDHFNQATQEQTIKKVDILFMMDHSGSMQDDWERVANNMQELVKELPSDTDIRYAVILGDVGAQRGKLYAPVGYPVVLDNQKMKVQEISQKLHKDFVEGMKVSDAGSGEALFHSLYHAVTTNAVANQKLGFFRPDAALSIIFMSDEQEIGYPFPSPSALAAAGLPSRCDAAFEDGVKRDYYDKKGINLDVTFNAVKALKGDMPVKTHAFINITKEDLFKRNSKNAKCLYDSLGYGFPEMVAKTKGVLFSIQENKAEGLSRCGKAIKESLVLQHDFALSKPADKVDPSTILARVDANLVDHEYRVGQNSVHLEYAGVAGSTIDIRHCEPDGRVNWNLTNFAGTPAQYSVGLSWKTAEYATSGKMLWGLAASSLVNQTDEPGTSTNHSVTVGGLTPNTVYYFQAVSYDEFGQVHASDVQSFRTLPDWTITGVSGTTSRTSASVSWTTSEYATKGRLLYGTSPGNLSSQSADTAVGNAHAVEVTGLSPDTTYYFHCVSSDEFGLEKHSDVLTLHTAADWGITNLDSTATRTSVRVVWDTTDQSTTGTVIYGPALGSMGSSVNASAGTSHSATVNGLTADATYYMQVVANDGVSEKRSAVFLVHTAVDWNISGFAGTSTQSEVDVSWTTPGYSTNGKVYFGSSDSALTSVVADSVTGTSHSAAVTGLNPDTLYYFQASSTDSDGVEKRSEVVAIRTQQLPLPTWSIGGFAGTSTKNSATLIWTTAQYATIGKILWGTALDSLTNEVAETASGTSHSVTVNGLAADTIYYFQAVSTDDRGQVKTSDVIAVRTMVDPIITPPNNWVIVGFDGTTTSSEANVIWQTPGANTKATVKVGTDPADLSLMAIDVPDLMETHLLNIPGLSPSTKYYFQVIAVDNTGRTVESVIITKTTKAP